MEESVAILKALASGFDPRSGEEFAEKGVWSDPRVIGALSQGAQALDVQLRRNAARLEKPLPPAAGQPWTSDEDERLKAEFQSMTSVRALAELHSRTRGAISARLLRLGLVEPPARPASTPVSPGA
jgi:hypothetical protein